MSKALKFVIDNPTLAPLFFCVGAGIVASGYFMGHVMKNHPDVIVDKRDPFKWNNVHANQNIKFMAVNQKFEGNPEIPKF